MADISTWSPTDESNTAAPPAGWPENMQPSAVNNSARGMMGAIRRWYDTVTAQLTSITASLANYLPLAGGNLTGPVTSTSSFAAAGDITTNTLVHSASNVQADGAFIGGSVSVSGNILASSVNTLTYQISGVTFANHGAGGETQIWDGGGGVALSLAGNDSVYQNDQHHFRNALAGPTFTVESNGNGTFAGNIATPGTITGANITASGTITGANITTAGTVTGANITASGTITGANITTAGTVTGAYVHSTGNIQADNAFTGGSVNVTGYIYGSQLRGGNGVDAGVLAGIPTADPARHTVAFGWDGLAAVFYTSIDASAAKIVPFSDTIRAFLLQADGGAPSGWHLAAFSGGTTFYIYVDLTSSDARMKRGIADSEVDALAALCAVPVRRFEWRDEVQATFGVPQGPVAIGLVAQDILPHMPDCVGISRDRGEPYPDDMHTLMYDRIHAYTIRAIQQLAAENAALMARVTALEGASHV